MCARYTLRVKLNLLLSQFAAEMSDTIAHEPQFNIAPTHDLLAIRQCDGRREFAQLRWGLIPSWAKDAKIAYSTINARADTVATKPAFRSAFRHRRCLVLADGYYEWLQQGKQKLPYFYEVDGGQPFAFAGLWESWQGLETCSLITTEANELAAQVKDRMPVILDAADYATWLAADDPAALQPLLAPFAAGRMNARRVGTYVNNVRNQGPECIAGENGA
jgi:putative SOS response-associated peptidase YedK